MEMGEKEDRRIRACIIGAGAAGLCAARHLAQHKSKFIFHVYEQTLNVGGTWNYTDSIGFDSNGLPIHSSMYSNMRTNLPLEIMEFQDFPSNSSKSFVHHSQVLKYLQNYAINFNLIQYIKFEHQIIKVSRSDQFWNVKVKDLKTEKIEENIYDAIFVCNGRYAKPNIPDKNQIKGLETFRGRIIHSHDYRLPQDFEGQTVLVLGAGPSGIDISIELSDVANQVVLCHHLREELINLPKNVKQEISKIKQISESMIEFENGNRYERVDAIIFATGYLFDYTFLDKTCQINVNSYGRVEGIYLHFINTSYPSMALFGVMNRVLPFQIYHQQVLFFIKCLTKELVLPSKSEMENEAQNDLLLRKSMGISERHAHSMFMPLLWQYSDKLVQMAHIMPVKPSIKKLFDHLFGLRKLDITGYKDLNFQIISDEQFITKQ